MEQALLEQIIYWTKICMQVTQNHKYEAVPRFLMHPIIWCNLLQKHAVISVSYFHLALSFKIGYFLEI